MQKLVQFPDGPGIDLIDIKTQAGHSPLAEAELAGWDEGAKWLVEVMNLKEDQQGEPTDEDTGGIASGYQCGNRGCRRSRG